MGPSGYAPANVIVLVKHVRRPGPLVAVSLAYLVLATALMIWRGISVSPDYLLVVLVPLAALAGRLSRFLRDWIPFVLIFLAWEAMRGVAPKLGFAPHVEDLASTERWLFGGRLPTEVLQHLTPGPLVHSLAVLGTIVYFCHFAFPVGVGMVMWLIDRVQFLRYSICLLGMSLAAFVVYLLAPTAPPWYAQNQGVVHGFTKLIDTTLPSAVSPYYQSLNPNRVAAFPSLHAAFPFLAYLALRTVHPRGARLALAWCVLVWTSVVYLGEHYAIDVAAGIGLAAASWWALNRHVVPRVAMLRKPGVAVVEPVAVEPARDAAVA